jgi:hypothetical protein
MKAPRPFTGPELEVGEIWTPYPLEGPEMPAYDRRRFDEWCNLAVLAHEMLRLLYEHDSITDPLEAWLRAQELGGRIIQWHHDLPSYLGPKENTPAHILTLQ